MDDQLDSCTPDASEAIGLRSELIAELAKLPRTQRAAIVMRFFEDMSDADIGTASGCRPATARGYLHRGLKALRVEMSSTDRILHTPSLEQAEQ